MNQKKIMKMKKIKRRKIMNKKIKKNKIMNRRKIMWNKNKNRNRSKNKSKILKKRKIIDDNTKKEIIDIIDVMKKNNMIEIGMKKATEVKKNIIEEDIIMMKKMNINKK